MSKTIAFSISTVLLFIFAFSRATMTKAAPAASVASYPASLDVIDTHFMTNYNSDINTRQNAYYNSNGQYFQGLRTHSVTPQVGFYQIADMLSSSPDDQESNWLDFWPSISAEIDYSMEIHTHKNKNGYGYTTILRAYDGSDYWIKRRSIGSGGWDTQWEKGR